MDAISFVLGVNSNQLRSSHLIELINRRSDAEISKPTGNKRRAGVVKEKGASKTVVSAYYMRSDNEELIFSRRYILFYYV
jgi:chromosome segregation ATPase